MRLLILLALLVAGTWFAPQFAEDTSGPCPALELRIAELLRVEAGKLPASLAGGPRLAGLLATVQGAASASGGTIARAYVRDRFPDLPPEPACVAGWWKLKFDPDLGPYLAAMTRR